MKIEVISEKIIEVLFNANGPITSHEISHQIGYSMSSVKRNMPIVREIAKTVDVSLESMSGKGFWLDGSNEAIDDLRKLIVKKKDKTSSFSYRRSLILKELSRINAHVTIQTLSENIFVSRRIITEDLVEIQKWLSVYNVELLIRPNIGVTLEGNEFDIRQAILSSNASCLKLVDRVYKLPKDLDRRITKTFYNFFIQNFDGLDILDFIDQLRTAEEKMNHRFSDFSFTQLIEYLAVAFERISEGHIIDESWLLRNYHIDENEFEAARELLLVYFDDCHISSGEIKSLASQFILYGTYENARLKDTKDFVSVASLFVSNLSKSMLNREISIGTKLIKDISLVFQKKSIQPTYTYINSNSLILDIKDNLSSLYAIILTNIDPVEKKLMIKLNENDIAYITLLISNSMRKTPMKVDVIFATTLDSQISKYMKNKILDEFTEINIIRVVHSDNLREVDYNDCDMLINTAISQDRRSIKVSKHINKEDFEIIKEQLERQMIYKKQIITRDLELFKENLIFINVRARNVEEVLELAATSLLNHNYVRRGFYSELIKRENTVPTSLGNGVAIPHVYFDQVNTNSIVLIKLDKSIEWTEDEMVDLVFVLAINIKDKKEMSTLFSKFYQLIDNNDVLSKIRESNSSSEIFHMLEGKVDIKRNTGKGEKYGE